MKKNQALALALGVLCAISLVNPTLAETRGQAVNQRQQMQVQRIQQGVKNGELTRREARHLKQNERRINRYEEHARADGKMSPQEFHKLGRMQHRESMAIHQQKHDLQERR